MFPITEENMQLPLGKGLAIQISCFSITPGQQTGLLQALGQRRQSKKLAGSKRDPDPDRYPSALSIVPTDRERGTGYHQTS